MANVINLKKAFYMEPEEIVKYFESKGLTTSFDWHEVYEDAHARAFTVAKMTQIDLLKDTQNMLSKAIKEGWSEGKFKKNATELFAKNGWTGFKEVTNPNGEKQTVELGTPRRIKKIFQCNMHSAYAAGRYKKQLENADVAPYLQYICVLDGKTRPEHRAMHEKVFRYDDKIWNTMYPPNGWNCRCIVRQLTQSDMKRKGLNVETSEGHLSEFTEKIGKDERIRTVYSFKKDGIDFNLIPDAGWNNNVGKTYTDILQEQMQAKISQLNIKELQRQLRLDVETAYIYQTISNNKKIAILEAHYKKYDDIIDKRRKKYNDICKIYKKSKTAEDYKKAKENYTKLTKTIEKQDIFLGKIIDSVINSINNGKSTLLLGKIGKNLKNEAFTLKNDLEKLFTNLPAIKINLIGTNDLRSYQSKGTIHLSSYYKKTKRINAGRSTSLHEAMHWLEEVDKNIGQKSIEFLEKRTINDKEEKLSVLTGNTKYKTWEVAKKDNFHNPYCGKIYKDKNNQYYGTEILSMGIQELLSNPIEFYNNDREYFKFVISILKGI